MTRKKPRHTGTFFNSKEFGFYCSAALAAQARNQPPPFGIEYPLLIDHPLVVPMLTEGITTVLVAGFWLVKR